MRQSPKHQTGSWLALSKTSGGFGLGTTVRIELPIEAA